jgi:hypothetical protein
MPSVLYANFATPLRDYATANQERLRKLAMGPFREFKLRGSDRRVFA